MEITGLDFQIVLNKDIQIDILKMLIVVIQPVCDPI